MKKRVFVLFLCMLFLAGTALAVVPRRWADDPDYYLDLENDLNDLDSTELYSESEDVYDSSDTYSENNLIDDREDSDSSSFTDNDDTITENPIGTDPSEEAVPGNDTSAENGIETDNQPDEIPVLPDDTQLSTPESDTSENTDPVNPEEVDPGIQVEEVQFQPDTQLITPEPVGPEISVTISSENAEEDGGVTGGGSFGPDFYDDEIDYNNLLRQYQELSPDDDPDIDIYPDEIIRYIIIDNPLIFVDETIELVPVEYPDPLAPLIETDSRNYPYRARVATHGGRLNVRSGPGTDYHVIGRIPNGSLVIVYGRSLDLNWAYVVCENGLQGFVLDAYLTTRNIFPKPAPTPAPAPNPALEIVGHIDFETTGLDGTSYKSTDFFDYNFVTLVNVWSTESTASVKEMKALQNINTQLSESNVAVVGICENATNEETVAKAIQILKDNDVSFINLVPPANMAQIFPVRGFPTTYFVDYNGNVWGAPIEGAYPDSYVDRLIEILNLVR